MYLGDIETAPGAPRPTPPGPPKPRPAAWRPAASWALVILAAPFLGLGLVMMVPGFLLAELAAIVRGE